MRRLSIPCSTLCLTASLLAPIACRRSAPPQANAVGGPYIPSAGSVPFDVSHVKGGDEVAGEWVATYASHGRTARFRIVIDPPDAGLSAVDQGRFIAEPGSDAAPLVSDLKKALEADSLPEKVKRLPELPFEYTVFGDHLSQVPGGGFQPNPAGNWTTLKVLIEDGDDSMRDEGDDQVEVFLNLNAALKKGEFSIRESDDGDAVVERLAQVL